MTYILINKNQATRALLNLADSDEDLVCLRIPTSNEAAADVELATIDNDYWCASSTYDETIGSTTDSILLPKKAINA